MNAKPNIVLITADSLRADRLGYGAGFHPSLTPCLDELASRSAVFTHAFAQGPYTSLSIPALFTGRYPGRLKRMGTGIHWAQPPGVVLGNCPTFVERLKTAGYDTAAFHSNPLVSRLFHFDRGFDVFFDDVVLSGSSLPARLKLTAARLQRVVRVDPYMSARELNQKVFAWLARARQPFFLWVHYMDSHGPYLARKTLKYVSRGERLWHKAVVSAEKITSRERQVLLDNYHRQIAAMDKETGRLLRRLEQAHPGRQNLVIFTADHGDEFFEHGGFSHKPKLYDELLHVPLLVRLPNEAPRRIEAMTELIQVAPTIAEFAGAATPGTAIQDDGFDSSSLLPALRGVSTGERDFIFAQAGAAPRQSFCVRTREWKLIVTNSAEAAPAKELYSLHEDPAEQVNLASQRPEIVQELESRLEAEFPARGLAQPKESLAADFFHQQLAKDNRNAPTRQHYPAYR